MRKTIRDPDESLKINQRIAKLLGFFSYPRNFLFLFYLSFVLKVPREYSRIRENRVDSTKQAHTSMSVM